jgi:hexosaminidase
MGLFYGRAGRLTIQNDGSRPGQLTVPAGAGAENVATLTANTTWGALRGLETLSQLVEWRDETGFYELRMAPWSIVDRPRFPYRGALIDTARHF